jgi:hypothetical protein
MARGRWDAALCESRKAVAALEAVGKALEEAAERQPGLSLGR